MAPGDLNKKYEAFSKAVKDNNAFDSKTTVMLYLASSLAVGCYP